MATPEAEVQVASFDERMLLCRSRIREACFSYLKMDWHQSARIGKGVGYNAISGAMVYERVFDDELKEFRQLSLAVHPDNHVVKLYESLGFVETERVDAWRVDNTL